MTIPNDLRTLAARQAVRMIADGVLRSEDLTEAYLARISEREPLIQAFAHFDADYARKSAASARPGALHGLPVGLKDVLDTADMPSQYGSPIWTGWRPQADSAPVAWTRAAGGVVIGKTVTTEFATRKPGPTANPANPGHTPGGSSSGSAAGVADGMFPVAFGTQTAGSIIRPAAYCGVVGYKPTYGMISRIGMKIMSDSLDTVGVHGALGRRLRVLRRSRRRPRSRRSGRASRTRPAHRHLPVAIMGSGRAGNRGVAGARRSRVGARRRRRRSARTARRRSPR